MRKKKKKWFSKETVRLLYSIGDQMCIHPDYGVEEELKEHAYAEKLLKVLDKRTDIPEFYQGIHLRNFLSQFTNDFMDELRGL